jgi:DNA polymerase III delta subunit
MLHVFLGSDTVAVRKAALAALASYEARGVVVARLDAETYETGALAHHLGGISLFGGEAVCVLDTPSEHDEYLSAVLATLPELAASATVFLLIETAPPADYRRALQKHATDLTELKAEAKEKTDPFALGNAFAARDKKTLWIVLSRELAAGTPAEQLAGLLWYQLKSLRLAALTKTAEEAGMKDFPYKKAKAALTKYSLPEVERLSASLLSVYHEGHSEKGDMAVGLERWVLGV